MNAFVNAVNNGYGIELDIHLTRDKKVVVFHDENIERMAGRNLDISKIDYEELRIEKLLNTNEPIPLLQDVLNMVSGRVPIMIEFKDIVNYKDLCEKAFIILDVYSGSYFVESFDPLILRWIKLNRRSVIRGQLSGLATKYNNNIRNPFLRFALSNLLFNFLSRPHFIAYELEQCNRFTIHIERALGAAIVAFTVKGLELAKKYTKDFDTVIFEEDNLPKRDNRFYLTPHTGNKKPLFWV